MGKTMPTIKLVYEPTKVVDPVYSPDYIGRRKEDRARLKAINDRREAEREAGRKERAAKAKQQEIADAMLDQSTRH